MNKTTSHHPNLMDRMLIFSGIAAPAFLLFSVIIVGALHPDYSHLVNPISALGAQGAPYRTILNYGGLVPTGVLTLLFSLAISRCMKDGTFLMLSVGLVALAGLGRFMAGIFPCDPGCLAFISLSAKIHKVAGLTSLTAGALAPLGITAGLAKLPRQRYFYISLILGTCALLTVFFSMIRMWPTGVGALQRLLLIFTYTWIVVTAFHLLRNNT